MSTEEFRNEQQFITSLYARLDDLREQAERAVQGALGEPGGGFQARLERTSWSLNSPVCFPL